MGNRKRHVTLVRLKLLKEVAIKHQSTLEQYEAAFIQSPKTNVTRYDKLVKALQENGAGALACCGVQRASAKSREGWPQSQLRLIR